MEGFESFKDGDSIIEVLKYFRESHETSEPKESRWENEFGWRKYFLWFLKEVDNFLSLINEWVKFDQKLGPLLIIISSNYILASIQTIKESLN